ncbi:MAG: binding-protein-dependent transport system inner rane component [Marmoricola sp.]|jgi:peptide/nickel transport system permease protein|nr:binding-protein-dependent transport system inner rane component [Marmoricola sp.]
MTQSESQIELLEPPPVGVVVEDKVAGVAGQSPTRLALGRFRKDRLSMIAFVVVAFYVVAAILAPILVKFDVIHPTALNPTLLNVDLGGVPNGAWGGMTWHHLLGLEPRTGTDLLSRLWYGMTFSLTIALTASVVAIVIGTVLGIISGFSGGIVDAVIGRMVDVTLSFPQTLMLLALSATGVALFAKILPGSQSDPLPNAVYEVLLLGLFGWPGIARLIRGQVLSIREREFVDAARLLGASRSRLYFKEILPNLWAPVLVQFTLIMPAYISAEAALGYLGVGIHVPTPTIGNILKDSVNYSQADFGYFFFPALLLAIIVVSFNLLGDGIGDALDPKADR